jgi:hypothetical protein
VRVRAARERVDHGAELEASEGCLEVGLDDVGHSSFCWSWHGLLTDRPGSAYRSAGRRKREVGITCVGKVGGGLDFTASSTSRVKRLRLSRSTSRVVQQAFSTASFAEALDQPEQRVDVKHARPRQRRVEQPLGAEGNRLVMHPSLVDEVPDGRECPRCTQRAARAIARHARPSAHEEQRGRERRSSIEAQSVAVTTEYVEHRLRRVGSNKLLGADVQTTLHEATHGQLRDIDRMVTNALRAAQTDDGRSLAARGRARARPVAVRHERRVRAPPARLALHQLEHVLLTLGWARVMSSR